MMFSVFKCSRRRKLLQQGNTVLRLVEFMLGFFFHAIVFLIVLAALSHIWLPIVVESKWIIEKDFSRYVGQTVKIEKIAVDWESEAPRWVLHNIRLFDANRQENIRIERLSMTLDRKESLRTLSIQPQDIEMEGMHAKITSNARGQFKIAGLKFPLPGQLRDEEANKKADTQNKQNSAKANVSDEMTEVNADEDDEEDEVSSALDRQGMIRFKVSRSKLLWQDDLQQHETRLDQIRLSGLLSADEISFELTGQVEGDDQQSLQFGGQLNISEHNGWVGQLKAKFNLNAVQNTPLNRLPPLRSIGGDINSIGQVTIREGIPYFMAGRFDFYKPVLLHLPREKFPEYQRWSLQGNIRQNSKGYYGGLGELSVYQKDPKKPIDRVEIHADAFSQFILFKFKSQSHIHLPDYHWLTQYLQGLFPETSHEVLQMAEQADLQGDLNQLSADFRYDYDRGELSYYRVNGELFSFNAKETKKTPGIQNLHALFEITPFWGHFNFRANQSMVSYSPWFDRAIPVAEMLADFSWQRTVSGAWELKMDRMNFHNRDWSFEGYGAYVDNLVDQPFLTLNTRFNSNRTLDNFGDYLPHIIDDEVYDWLKKGIVKAKVSDGLLQIAGPPDLFPYIDQKKGLFEVSFKVEEGLLHYSDDWGDLSELSLGIRFLGKSMKIDLLKGQAQSAPLKSAVVRIDHMVKEPSQLTVRLSSQAEINQQLEYLRTSPLAKEVNHFLKQFKVAGQSLLDLSIDVPLSDEETVVSGQVALSQGSIVSQEGQQRIDALQGKVYFGPDGSSSEGLIGRYLDKPLAISVQTDPEQNLMLHFRQRQSLARLLHTFEPNSLWTRYIKGESNFDLKVKRSLSNDDPKNEALLQARLTSDLKGTTLNGPKPLIKQAQASWPLDVNVDIEGDALKVQGQLNKELSFKSQIMAQKNMRLAVALGSVSDLNLPSQGVNVSGKVSHLDPMAWFHFIEQIQAHYALSQNKNTAHSDRATQANAQFQAQALQYKPIRLNLHMDQLKLLSRTVNDVTVLMDEHSIQVDAPQWVVIWDHEQNFSKEQLWKTRLHVWGQALDLQQWNKDWTSWQSQSEKQQTIHANPSPLSPQLIPKLLLECVDCRFGEMKINALRLQTQSSSQKVTLDDAQIQLDSGQVVLEGGVWEAQGSKQNTSISVLLDFPEPERFIRLFSRDFRLSQGAINWNGQFHWQGSPFDVSLDRLEGDTHFHMGAGHFAQVDLDVIRWLGLLNLESTFLQNLNEDDARNTGLPVDRISAFARLQRGILKLDKLVMETPVMSVIAKGETNLQAKTYQQNIRVIPKIGMSTALIAGASGGIVLGVAVAALSLAQSNDGLLLDRGDEPVGLGVRFGLSGSWR